MAYYDSELLDFLSLYIVIVYAADGTMQFLRKDLILNSRLVR